MELALAEKTMFLPPLIVAILAIIYRNTIFCFQCSDLYGSVQIVSDNIMKNITTMIDSRALIIQQESRHLVGRGFDLVLAILTSIQNAVGMIVTNIQGMCLTIYESIEQKITLTSDFLHGIFDSISTFKDASIEAFDNLWVSKPAPFYEMFYTPVLLLLFVGILVLTISYLRENRVLTPEDTPIPEPIEVAPVKRQLVRRKPRTHLD